jgi:hypothetical protein
MDADYLSSSPSEATVYAGPLDDDMVKSAGEVPGVEAVQGIQSTNANVIQPAGPKISIQFTAVEDPNHRIMKHRPPGETRLPALGKADPVDACTELATNR